MSVNDFFTSAYPIISILTGMAGLATLIYKIGDWINKKAAQRSEEIKKKNEEENEKNMNILRTLYEEKFDALKSHQDLINGNVKMLTRKLNKILSNQKLDAIK